MVVPVIESHHLRNDSMEYRRNKQKYDTKPVTISLLSANRKISDNDAERTFRCQFNLKSLKYSNTATYYLVIADEQGLQMPQREPFQIDIAFAVDEFDFFS